MLNNLAYLLTRENRPIEAVPLYRQSIGLVPENLKTYLGLGLALEKSGQITEAVVVYRHLLELDDRNTEAQKRIRALLSDPTTP